MVFLDRNTDRGPGNKGKRGGDIVAERTKRHGTSKGRKVVFLKNRRCTDVLSKHKQRDLIVPG